MNALLRKLFARLQSPEGDQGAAGGGDASGQGAGAGEGGAATGSASAADKLFGDKGAAGEGGEETKGAAGEGGGEGEGEGDERVIPDEYTITPPEGAHVIVDEEIASEFKAMCKELNLTQAEADRAAAIGFKITQKQQEYAIEQVKQWEQASRNDPELGGANLEANHAIAEKGVDLIASPELKNLLIATGMSNHPEVFRAFHKLGKMIEDDKFVGGSAQGTSTEVSRADKLFGSKKS